MAGYGVALNILMGDFNFVMKTEERIGGEEKKFTGDSDKSEAKHAEGLLKKMDFEELEQHQYTYRFEEGRSKIDRMYTNMRQFEKLDRDIGCVALGWKDHLSRHRPISGYTRMPQKKEARCKPLGENIMNDKDWAR